MKYLLLSVFNLMLGVFFLVGANLCEYMLPMRIASGLSLVCFGLGIWFFNLRIFEIFKEEVTPEGESYISGECTSQ